MRIRQGASLSQDATSESYPRPKARDLPMIIDSKYQAAGVDLTTASQATERISRHARTTFNSRVLGDIGFFGGLYHLEKYRDPVLVSSADGVRDQGPNSSDARAIRHGGPGHGQPLYQRHPGRRGRSLFSSSTTLRWANWTPTRPIPWSGGWPGRARDSACVLIGGGDGGNAGGLRWQGV